jgi:hypothetical protein
VALAAAQGLLQVGQAGGLLPAFAAGLQVVVQVDRDDVVRVAAVVQGKLPWSK